MSAKEKAEIMNMFRYKYRNQWCPESIFAGKTRRWIQAFNSLIKEGLIERKKTPKGYNYKWKSIWPENY